MPYNLRERRRSKINYTKFGVPIKALYINSLPPQITKSALKSHFGKYGELTGCDILLSITGFKYAVVTFDKAEDAFAAFAQKIHRLFKQKLHVSHGQKYLGPSEEVYRASDPANGNGNENFKNLTGTCLTSLNDDCLNSILSNLSISDLCSISETCVRLRDVARYVFTTLSDPLLWNILRASTFRDARRILVNFGPLVQKLYLSPVDISNPCQQLNLIIQYCGNTLKCLCLTNVVVNKTMALKMQILFTNLEEIRLFQCSIHPTARSINIFANCKRLELLHITHGAELKNLAFGITFPTLQTFRMRVDMLPNWNGLRTFISRHPQIKKLLLKAETPYYSDYYVELFEAILENLKCLEQLSIFCHPTDPTSYRNYVQRLSELQHLNRLLLDCAGQSISSFLNELKSMDTLEELTLHETIADEELFTTLAKYRHLKILVFVDANFVGEIRGIIASQQLTRVYIKGKFPAGSVNANSVDWLFDLVENLPKLFEIRLCQTSIVLDDYVYLKLVEIVASQSNRATLKLFTDCDMRVERGNLINNRKFVEYIYHTYDF